MRTNQRKNEPTNQRTNEPKTREDDNNDPITTNVCQHIRFLFDYMPDMNLLRNTQRR
jgi:hypothetical protein